MPMYTVAFIDAFGFAVYCAVFLSAALFLWLLFFEYRAAGIKYAAALWLRVRSNPAFVAVSGAAFGAACDTLYDQLERGGLDLSAQGLHKLASAALLAAVTAVIHLYRPSPNNPTQ